MRHGHIPVLLHETLHVLAPKNGDGMLDVTLGLGGHAEALLNATAPSGTLVALDADEENMRMARERLQSFDSRVMFIHSNFSALPECLPDDRRRFDVVFADLGLSSPHVDDASRGFSFRASAPLDMRYDRTAGMTAADILSQWDPQRLRELFKDYGELPQSGRFVDAIVLERSVTSIATSEQLVTLVDAVYKHHAKDVLPQVFQALRIAVNNELVALQTLLAVAPELLTPDGRFAVITYHSLEDVLVKRRFRELSTPPKDPITGQDTAKPSYSLLTKKAIKPEETEVRNNPRARSARLRALQKA